MAYLSHPIFTEKNRHALDQFLSSNSRNKLANELGIQLTDLKFKIAQLANDLLYAFKNKVRWNSVHSKKQIEVEFKWDIKNGRDVLLLTHAGQLISMAWSIQMALKASSFPNRVNVNLYYEQNGEERVSIPKVVLPERISNKVASNLFLELLDEGRPIVIKKWINWQQVHFNLSFAVNKAQLIKYSKFFAKVFSDDRDSSYETIYQVRISKLKILTSDIEKTLEDVLNFINGVAIDLSKDGIDHVLNLLKVAQFWDIEILKRNIECHLISSLTLKDLDYFSHIAEEYRLEDLYKYCAWYKNPPPLDIERFALE